MPVDLARQGKLKVGPCILCDVMAQAGLIGNYTGYAFMGTYKGSDYIKDQLLIKVFKA